MPQIQRQYQMQTEAQLLKLSPLQLETAKLLELSITQLEDRVEHELIENNSLDVGKDESNQADTDESDRDDGNNSESVEDEEFNNEDGNEKSYDEDDDEIPVVNHNSSDTDRDIPLGDTVSFIDDLLTQMEELDLSEHQKELIEYLIGSLDDNGFVDASLTDIADEMLFHHNIYTDETELEEALHILQQFDPAGIGARNSQESLLIQIDRKMNDKEHLLGDKYFLLEDARTIISEHYSTFLNNNIEKLQNVLEISSARMKLILAELKKLNLRPGLALCEAASDRIASAIPDFIVETGNNGTISFHLNNGELPMLRVSKFYKEKLKSLDSNKRRQDQESAKFIKEKIDAAQLFIEAIKLRQHTLTVTMQALIDLQRNFFLTQDPDDLNRLILKDVADKTGLDISTISRVCNNKYCLLDGRLYQLSRFFKRSRANADGEEVDAEKVRKAIKYIISKENKKNPFTDEKIAQLLAKAGINIKRRTVAKYRDEIGIPIAKNRKNS